MQNKEEYGSNDKKEFYSFLLVSEQLIIVTVTNWGHKYSVVPMGIVTVSGEPACIMRGQYTHIGNETANGEIQSKNTILYLIRLF